MKIKNKILCLLLLLLLLMISLLVFVNKKESINALVLYRSSIDELGTIKFRYNREHKYKNKL